MHLGNKFTNDILVHYNAQWMILCDQVRLNSSKLCTQ